GQFTPWLILLFFLHHGFTAAACGILPAAAAFGRSLGYRKLAATVFVGTNKDFSFVKWHN
ncbi:MAG: hypothetical protein R3281_04835, partial [Balneolaceae bacterium]|nr:hypothetical protein [Balneolaceae bacterium]